MAWSLLSRYLVSCPSQNPRVDWTIYPWLSVTNEPDLLIEGYNASITHNRTSLTKPGRVVTFAWDQPGQTVSYNSTYNTSIGGLINTTVPQYAAWISQLNVTYTPLNIAGNNTASTIQPGGYVFNNTDDGVSYLSEMFG